ncbi:MAG: helicase-related protein [Ignavibacterium sp.]|nr:helicase-related protein [Ignavibacterium sp.]MDW8376488.1 helicase-related protein [Ignavibacteriales bacterium]
MLIDNKTIYFDNIKTVKDFFELYVKSGRLNIVSAYFSISMLTYLFRNFQNISDYKLILGSITGNKSDEIVDKTIDLLLDEDMCSAINLSIKAKDAIKFVESEKVNIKTVHRSFCHAKAYIFESDNNDPQKSFFILGSSNFTESGFGLKISSNIELNKADFAASSDYNQVLSWFMDLWESKYVKDSIELNGKTISFKKYLIETIKKFYQDYSPRDLYYKVLYEYFKKDILDFEPNSFLNKQIEHLKDTIIYNSLYPFQQKGVLSLIKKLQKYDGAILADAVGLGKTWQALAVIKYFELQGFRVFLFCPKKLENNWRKYLEGHNSKFEKDKLKFTIRFHTDLQGERISSYDDRFTLENHFQNNPKVLIVIDESHNLRNDKSIRYQFLVDNILKKNKEVKVLMLSATPINTKLLDIRNQFKLIVKGDDNGFNESEFRISSLQSLFASAQRDFNEWQKSSSSKISEFINKLPQDFFSLTDSIVVARTREFLKGRKELGEFEFPEKEKPENIFISPKNIGKFKTFEEILESLEINLTAYKPAQYTKTEQFKSVLEDERQRQKFLVKMMYILLIKRLESSWFSFKLTVKNILDHHQNALDKVNFYIQNNKEQEIDIDLDKNIEEDLEETSEQFSEIIFENKEINNFTIGKKNPIPISSIIEIDKFKEDLENDIKKLSELINELDKINEIVEKEPNSENKFKSVDEKLEKLIELINKKQNESINKKVIVFSVYKDTAYYLYNQLKNRGFTRIAFISGDESKTDDGYSGRNFEPILERFAPYAKLFLEKDWSVYYKEDGIIPITDYEKWKSYIFQRDKNVKEKLEKPIDILISTDCLSEGQNLQDCDCIINYDIHWNPVRLIQRLGRIDRLASPNKKIKGINFWPADSYEDFLNLRRRVERRMALLTVIGAEIEPNITYNLEKIAKENPLLSRQEEKMLEQLQISWDDIEDNKEVFGFDKLSLENFRQELYQFLLDRSKELEKIPNGVFTGFKQNYDIIPNTSKYAIIALIGYPKKKLNEENSKYEILHLVYADGDNPPKFINDVEILKILQVHINNKRYVPDEIDKMNQQEINTLRDMLRIWLRWKAESSSIKTIEELLNQGIKEQTVYKGIIFEDLYKEENFDLITWFVISR